MSIYKRGNVYWYKVMWQGELIRKSTKQGSDRVARQIEAAHRTALARAEVGIREKKQAPTLAEFSEKRFAPWAESATSQKTWLDYYRPGVRAIQTYKPLASLRLDEITSERSSDFASWRRSQGLQVSSVNSSLQVLRRILHLAVEWGVIEKAPRIKLLPGERRRERVLGQEEEARYLAAAPAPLASIATVLADTGIRPNECYCLRWEAVTWINGRNGSFLVTHGKTDAARRVLPMTARVRATLQARWETAGRACEGWIWPAPTRAGHVDRSSLKKQHKKALRVSGVPPFVLYSLRHTFATRIAPHVDPWTLCKIMGWASLSVAMRYIHPSDEWVLAAISGLSGHKIGHTQETAAGAADVAREVTALLY